MMLRSGRRSWRLRTCSSTRAPASLLPAGRPRPSQVLCATPYARPQATPSHRYSTVAPSDEVTVEYRHGLPMVTLRLPSRSERCQFVVKPMLSTVGSFLQDICSEDKGIRSAAILTADGCAVPASTSMGTLLVSGFRLVIDQKPYDVRCPVAADRSGQHSAELDSLKALVLRLYTVLHMDELQKQRERHLVERVGHLTRQLLPLEQVKAGIEAHTEAKVSRRLWAGLALLSVQGGALAWLTWWVYSWDIMEPVTYFLTVANSMVFFAYFITTRQNYTYEAASSRQLLHFFHKRSQRQQFDVQRYNELKEELAKAKGALSQLRRSQHLRKQQSFRG